MKKLLSMFLVIIMITILSAPGLAQAASVKLNKTSLTLNEGNSYRLQVTGTTKTVKWTTSDKKIATVSSRGTVKAIKEGTVTITATVSSKKYTCKVKVKDVLTNEEAAANITYQATELPEYLLLVLENKNKANVQLKVEVTYYDNNNAVLSTDNGYLWVMESGKQAVMYFSYPHDDNYENVSFSDYKIKLSAELEYVSSDKVIDYISTESNSGSSNLVVTATNNSDDDISAAKIYVLYYMNNKIVGFDFNYFSDISAGGSITKEFHEPYDDNYNDMEYDDYEIIINEASFE